MVRQHEEWFDSMIGAISAPIPFVRLFADSDAVLRAMSGLHGAKNGLCGPGRLASLFCKLAMPVSGAGDARDRLAKRVRDGYKADMQRLVLALAFVVTILSSSGWALAQQTAAPRTGFGAGAEVTTTGIVGGTFVYDAGAWHGDFLLGSDFAHEQRSIALAGRFFFVLDRTAAADFSIGPGIGLLDTRRYGVQPDGSDEHTADIHLEGALQIRAFVVSNVALSASAGLGIILRNSPGHDEAVVGGQSGGAFGITYFFY